MGKRKRRVDGKDGWKKDHCQWTETGWSWTKFDGEKYCCTCTPCQPPRERGKIESKVIPMRGIKNGNYES